MSGEHGKRPTASEGRGDAKWAAAGNVECNGTHGGKHQKADFEISVQVEEIRAQCVKLIVLLRVVMPRVSGSEGGKQDKSGG